ncbi:hypothetical protein [Cohnella lupini]|uniref:Uncharacterized protein n=1 Tax=Cohnella lupini TaxID=1294267 RepID=A0A3D9HTH6_9BACL|nr:hypothetical protein [Cohnella lupini]RED52812.1 hypothetical protein DFP95_13016 [Cohnella lupini]
MSQSQLNESISVIANELNSLLSDASDLRALYGEASAACDLTFIKILELKYEALAEEIKKLTESVSSVQESLIDVSELEGIGHGR